MANDERDDEETLAESEEDEELEDESEEDEDEPEEDEDEGSDDDEDGGDDEPEEDASSDDEPEEDASSDDDEPASDEDDDEDEEDEDDRPARASAKRSKGKGAKKVAKQKSAAARLAAARAAKAARKAAKRGKELKDEKAPIDTLADSKVAQQAATFSDWASQNKPTVYGVVAAIVLIVGGTIGWLQYQEAKTADAGAALAAAVETANARIRDEDEIPDEDDPPSYTSVEERAEAALTAYDAVIGDHSGTPAAAWAQVGRGEQLLALGRASDARGAFEAAIAAGGDDGAILWRALEGKGFTYEAEEDWDHAIETYEELSRTDDGRFAPVARYHIARMYIAKDQTEQATETLSELVESLRDAENDEDEQDYSYVLAQAEVRLRELDPSAVPARPTLGGGPLGGGSPLGGGGPGGDSQLSPEQLQELIRRFQEQQQQGGGGGEGE